VTFENWIEGPHSNPHRWVAFQMISMSSPDDPLFFSHHANVDRLYAIWQDCNDFELIDPENYTSIHYSNITNYASNGVPYWNYGIDSPMPFFWLPGNQDSFAIRNSPFPTPRNVCSMGTENGPNYDGMYFRYINDALVGSLGADSNGSPTCVNNKAGWNLVYPPGATGISRKRNLEENSTTDSTTNSTTDSTTNSTTNSTTINRDTALNGVGQGFQAAAAVGLAGPDALHFTALQECLNTPQIEIDASLEAWMQDQGTRPEQYDRVCDSSSQRYHCKPERISLGNCQSAWVEEQAASHTIAVFFGMCGGILVVVVIVVIITKRKKLQNDKLEAELAFDQYKKLDG